MSKTQEAMAIIGRAAQEGCTVRDAAKRAEEMTGLRIWGEEPLVFDRRVLKLALFEICINQGGKHGRRLAREYVPGFERALLGRAS
ncbi:MAG: hypothetical protein ACK5AZ_12420 [Bryobacteraceae bacterium]